eukprot:TRINITY_DN8094_c0_g1_i1.p1 TRINITY_DN8094_c0_g1~~TRINITY_DN8094_c0_g1_i1.p1  ORF type:complete len:216 (+),score=73.75 TRINITY_DN8094_c0_g1_i1:99-650(+)
MGQSEKDGITCYMVIDENGIAMARGEGVVGIPVQELREFLSDNKRVKDYDDMVDKIEVIEIISPNIDITWQKVKGMLVVSPRDYVYLSCSRQKEDGTLYLLGRSIDHPQRPPTKDAVRAFLHIGGWILKPVEGRPDATHYIYMVKTDLKGSLPKGIVTNALKKQAFRMIEIEQAFRKYKKKNV